MRHDKPARVFGYARVSGREQGDRGTSLAGQRASLERWCRERDYPRPTIIVEVESAVESKRERRVELDKLLAAARPRDLVIVTLVDRWSRDLVYGVDSVRRLTRAGIGWVAVEEDIDASTEHGMGRLEDQMLGAQREAARIKKRMVGARDRIRDAGGYPEGPAPLGYRRGSRAERRQCELEVVPTDAALVRELFERSVDGASLLELQEWLAVEIDRTLAKHTLQAMLRNRIYLGEVEDSRGTWIKGKHEAIIEPALFQASLDALVARRKGGRKPSATTRTATWLLRGLGACPECGARMGAAYSRGTDYYACGTRVRAGSCSAPYARVSTIDPLVAGRALERLQELRGELAQPAPVVPGRAVPDFGARRARIAAAVTRAERGYVDGVLDVEALRRERERLGEELGRLEVAARAASALERAGDPRARAATLSNVEALSAAWAAAPVEVRRAAVGVLASSIRIHATDVEIAWKTPAELCTATVAMHLFSAPDDVPPDPAGKRGRR